MPKRVELPPELHAGPFAIGIARSSGIGEGRLRGTDLERPFHGVRAHPADDEPPARTQVEEAAAELRRVQARCASYAPLLAPGHFFSHLTAARLWRLPLPERFSEAEQLHVSAPRRGRGPRGRGVAGHEAPDAARVVQRYSFPVSDPVTTWLALARFLSLDDLVAAGDGIVLEPYELDPRDPRPLASLEDLAAGLTLFRGKGARAALAALPYIREGAESHRETLLRLLLGRAGLPEPELNGNIYNGAGRWLGRGDIIYRQWKVLVEYDGDDHRRNVRAYERDIVRIEGIIAARWTVIRVRNGGLGSGSATTVRRVTEALRARGWRP